MAALQDERARTWFQQNPKKTVAIAVILLVALVDLIAGLLFIPTDFNAFRCPNPDYHHDLRPNQQTIAAWGGRPYPMITDSLGFRDAAARAVPLGSPQKRILLLGDSFTEGMGVPYEETFAGILARSLQPAGVEVLNAAAVSYSPKLYYLKARYLLERRRLRFERLIVFIDISDIHDEIAYALFQPSAFPALARLRFQLKTFLKHRSFLAYALMQMAQASRDPHLQQLQADGLFPCLANLPPELLNNDNFRKKEGTWTFDPLVYRQYGAKGLKLAAANMEELTRLCRAHSVDLTVAVYPWPAQILHRDRDSIQARFWQKFAEDHRIGFIDLFPRFMDEPLPAQTVCRKYFIDSDVHWNAAGHRLVADTVLAYLRDHPAP